MFQQPENFIIKLENISLFFVAGKTSTNEKSPMKPMKPSIVGYENPTQNSFVDFKWNVHQNKKYGFIDLKRFCIKEEITSKTSDWMQTSSNLKFII